MIALALALLLGAAEEAREPVPTPAVAELPPVAGGSRYGAPASLPPVSAQLFHLKGMLEIQPMFAFSIGDPFWRTMAVGLRGEQHLDERWSLSGHILGGVSL